MEGGGSVEGGENLKGGGNHVSNEQSLLDIPLQRAPLNSEEVL